jgi:hypothetical protein
MASVAGAGRRCIYQLIEGYPGRVHGIIQMNRVAPGWRKRHETSIAPMRRIIWHLMKVVISTITRHNRNFTPRDSKIDIACNIHCNLIWCEDLHSESPSQMFVSPGRANGASSL